MKIYVEVNGGVLSNVYTDDLETDIDVVLCDRDDANAETEGDGFDFQSTKACKELDTNLEHLKRVF